MPRPCSICQRHEREAIDQALAAKEPLRTVAERFGTSPAALHRHQAHAPPPAHTVPMAQPLTHALPIPGAPALLDTAERLHATACQIQQRTVEVRSTHDMRMLENVEQLSRLHVEVTGLLTEVLGLLATPTVGSAPSGR